MAPLSFIAPSLPLYRLHTLEQQTRPRRRSASRATCSIADSQYDIITIGSGLGSLTSALLLSPSLSCLVLESHTVPGGAAHSFTRRTPHGKFTFESGPHLFSGLSPPSDNPLSHALQAAGVELPVIGYDTWGVFIGQDYVPTKVRGDEPFLAGIMSHLGGESAVADMQRLIKVMEPLGKAATAIPPAALRAGDIWGSLKVLGRFLKPEMLANLPYIPQMTKPFGPLLDRTVSDPFARNFVNLLCFLLAGVQAETIPTAEVAFMFREWTSGKGIVLERPVGGASGIVKAMVEGITKNGGVVRTGCHVSRVLVEDGKAVGVKLRNGEKIYARRGIIGGISALDTPKLLQQPSLTGEKAGEMCESFMHLHLAVKLTDEVMRDVAGGKLESNYVSVEDFSKGMECPDNVVLISCPSAIDPDVCPEGWATIHAYTPATEPYEPWSGLEPNSEEYEAYKKERAAVLWRAVDKIFGREIEPYAEIKLIGTPKTHEKYLRRKRGSYGPKVNASSMDLGLPFPGETSIAGFYRVGDGVFPGIGVPAVAASGWIVANGLTEVEEHIEMLRRAGLC